MNEIKYKTLCLNVKKIDNTDKKYLMKDTGVYEIDNINTGILYPKNMEEKYRAKMRLLKRWLNDGYD